MRKMISPSAFAALQAQRNGNRNESIKHFACVQSIIRRAEHTLHLPAVPLAQSEQTTLRVRVESTLSTACPLCDQRIRGFLVRFPFGARVRHHQFPLQLQPFHSLSDASLAAALPALTHTRMQHFPNLLLDTIVNVVKIVLGIRFSFDAASLVARMPLGFDLRCRRRCSVSLLFFRLISLRFALDFAILRIRHITYTQRFAIFARFVHFSVLSLRNSQFALLRTGAKTRCRIYYQFEWLSSGPLRPLLPPPLFLSLLPLYRFATTASGKEDQ